MVLTSPAVDIVPSMEDERLAQAAAQAAAHEFYARTYDAWVRDWPGELDFYRSMAGRMPVAETLELGAGTGRIAIRLARAGFRVTGLDLSAEMLAVAESKSATIPRLRWVLADMRTFELGRRFGLVIAPGHAFQNLLTTEDQLACLERALTHLLPTGTLVLHVDHQDIAWLGDIHGSGAGVFEPAETFVHPGSGRQVRASRAWAYERATQTAITTTVWEELDESGEVVTRLERGPTRIHCVFRSEMEHLLGRAGFALEALYGDFLGGPLGEESSEMVWVARPRRRASDWIAPTPRGTRGLRPSGRHSRSPRWAETVPRVPARTLSSPVTLTDP
jgi:SAM-dependent methyltransferase